MSVAGISSSNLFDFSSQSIQNRKQQFQRELTATGARLAIGEPVRGANRFRDNSAVRTATQFDLVAQNASPIVQDFKQLSQDIQSGDISAAQQDYAKLQQDFQSHATGKHAHHHHQGGGEGGASAISQLLQQLGQDLQTGSLSAAQQAYSTLQQDFQQFAQSTGLFASSQSNPNPVSVNA